MKQKRFTEQQIAFALRQAEQGTAVEEITRKLGVPTLTPCIHTSSARMSFCTIREF